MKEIACGRHDPLKLSLQQLAYQGQSPLALSALNYYLLQDKNPEAITGRPIVIPSIWMELCQPEIPSLTSPCKVRAGLGFISVTQPSKISFAQDHFNN